MSETIADIVREMRGYAADMAERYKEAVKGDKHLDCNIVSFRTSEFAFRIKAAHEREMADALNTGAFVEATRKLKVDVSVLDTTTKGNLGVGNGAKIREALLMVKKLFDGGIMFQSAIREAHKAVNAALAEPPRNCDRFGGDIDKLRETCLRERGLNPEEDFPDVFPDWLLAPSTAKESGVRK